MDEPRQGAFKHTVLDASFNAFDLDRYMLIEADHRMHEIAAQVPYDAIIVLVNSKRYGGGSISMDYCCTTVDNARSLEVFVHELGHSFAGLADEYYASEVSYNDFYPKGVEPREPNITALLDPANVKWKDLLSPGIGVPTEYGKDAIEALQAERQKNRKAQADEIAAAKAKGGAEAAVGKIQERFRGDGQGDRGEDRRRPEAVRRAQRQGRRVRGGGLRGQGPLPAAGLLHHDLEPHGRVLRGLPAGHRPDDRILRRGDLRGRDHSAERQGDLLDRPGLRGMRGGQVELHVAEGDRGEFQVDLVFLELVDRLGVQDRKITRVFPDRDQVSPSGDPLTRERPGKGQRPPVQEELDPAEPLGPAEVEEEEIRRPLRSLGRPAGFQVVVERQTRPDHVPSRPADPEGLGADRRVGAVLAQPG